MNRGETRAWRDGKNGVAWRDKGKPTVMISMVHQALITRIDSCRAEIRMKPLVVLRMKPLVVDRYSQGIGDQYGVYYSIETKSKKWWRKLVFWLLEVAIMNLYILYKETVVSPLSHVDYR